MKTIKKLIITATVTTCLTPMPHMHAMHQTDTSLSKQEMRNNRIATKINQILTAKTKRSQEELLTQLMENNDINHQNKYGETLLMMAIKKNNESLVKLLLEDYPVNARLADNMGITPLMAATEQNSLDLVNRLMEYDKNLEINAISQNGETVLDIAVKRNANPEIIQKLTDAGAHINPAAHINQSAHIDPAADVLLFTAVDAALLPAVKNGDIKLILQSITNSTNIDHINDDGNNALMIALSQSRDHNIIRMLIEHGINTDIINKIGKTALMLAIHHGHSIETVRLLLNKSTQTIDIPDHNKQTPLDKALFKSKIDIANLLIEYGAQLYKDSALSVITKTLEKNPNTIGAEQLTMSLILAGAKDRMCKWRPTYMPDDQYQNLTRIRGIFSQQDYELRDYKIGETESIAAELPEALILLGDSVIKLIDEYSSPYSADINRAEFPKAVIALGDSVINLINEYHGPYSADINEAVATKKAAVKEMTRRKKMRHTRNLQRRDLQMIIAANTENNRATEALTAPLSRLDYAATRQATTTPRTIACRACSFDNSTQNTHCEICLAPLSAEAPALTPPTSAHALAPQASNTNVLEAADEIECFACTFLNKAQARGCAMCGTPFQG